MDKIRLYRWKWRPWPVWFKVFYSGRHCGGRPEQVKANYQEITTAEIEKEHKAADNNNANKAKKAAKAKERKTSFSKTSKTQTTFNSPLQQALAEHAEKLKNDNEADKNKKEE